MTRRHTGRKGSIARSADGLCNNDIQRCVVIKCARHEGLCNPFVIFTASEEFILRWSFSNNDRGMG